MKNILCILLLTFSIIVACELPGPQQDESNKEQQMAQPEMIKIEGGPVHPFGTGETVTVSPFYIDKHLVTYEQYNQFIEDRGYKKKNIGRKKGASFLKNMSSGCHLRIMRNI